jgi:hypothetical protein
MTQKPHRANPWLESLITAVAVGGTLIILAVAFGLTPGVPEGIVDFFSDLTGQTYPLGNGQLVLPAPGNPDGHLEVYSAVFNFMLGISILQIVILAMRLYANSQPKKIAETVGNMIFWLGGAVMAYLFLIPGTLSGWFSFWPALIIFIGLSLIAQAFVRFILRRT